MLELVEDGLLAQGERLHLTGKLVGALLGTAARLGKDAVGVVPRGGDGEVGLLDRRAGDLGGLGPGCLVEGTDLSLTENAAIGNAVAGVEIAAESDAPLLSKNNFIGNGTPEGNGCGVLSSASSPVEAATSYWGAATGPGPRPADDACGAAGVVATPFATKPIKVKPKLPIAPSPAAV